VHRHVLDQVGDAGGQERLVDVPDAEHQLGAQPGAGVDPVHRDPVDLGALHGPRADGLDAAHATVRW
jgi:hypothetical protein